MTQQGSPEHNEPKILRGKKKARDASKKASSLGNVTIEPLSQKQQRPGLFKFTMGVLYKALYLLGITLLRRRLRLKRRFKKVWLHARNKFFELLYQGVLAAAKGLLNFWVRLTAPFTRIRRTYNEVLPDIKAKRAARRFPVAAYLAILEQIGRLILKIVATIFNYTAPVAAGIFLYVVVKNGVNQPWVRLLEYKGEVLGYVQSESEFTAAAMDVRSRVTTDGENAFTISEPHFETVTLAQIEQRKNEGTIPQDIDRLQRDELADKLIRMSGSEVDEAYGLYVDNKFIGAVVEKEPVLNEFKRIKASNMTGKPDEKIDFVKSIRLTQRSLYPRTSIKDNQAVIEELSKNETADEIYIVKAGDSPSLIADKTGVPYTVLKELNPNIEESLFAGMEVFTQIARPFMSVSSSYTDIVEEEVPFETVETKNATYARGYRNVYQEGVAGSRLVTYSVTSANGLEVGRVEMASEMIKYPVDERVTVGVNDPQVIPAQQRPQTSGGTAQPAATVTAGTGGFIRPVAAGVGYVSASINGYWGHTGVDIAVRGGTGTNILASASGTVVLAKNTNVGYGRYIIIDHGNGYQTLYAHNSQLYVSVGDRVAQGQVIAAMGRTGNATGVHVHFEVRQNGRIMNPANYIGSR